MLRYVLFSVAVVVAAIAILTAGWVGFGGASRARGSEGRLVPASDRAILTANTSDEQRAALADGIVTRAEYEAAVRATASCLGDSGVATLQVDEPAWEGEQLTFAFHTANAEARAAASSAYDACFDRYQRNVALAWSGISQPRSAAEVAQANDAVGACLRTHGAKVPDRLAFNDLVAAGHALADPSILPGCVEQAVSTK